MIPSNIIAGSNYDLTLPSSTFPIVDGATLSLKLKRADESAQSISASVSGADWALALSGTTTGALATGRWRWWLVYTASGKTDISVNGSLTVEPGPDSADARTQSERILAKLRAAYETLAEREYTEVSINGRSVKYSKAELRIEIAHYELKVERERTGSSGIKYKKISFV